MPLVSLKSATVQNEALRISFPSCVCLESAPEKVDDTEVDEAQCNNQVLKLSTLPHLNCIGYLLVQVVIQTAFGPFVICLAF